MAKTTLLRLADLPTRKITQISYIPNAEAMAQLADEMDLSALRKMRLEGTLQPLGNKDWQLQARLGATVVQPCGVTLEPVTTRIEEPIFRQYLSDWEAPTGAEAEMDGDDTSDPLPETLDLAEIAAEALAMAVPRYPRVEGATLGQADFAEPGVAPLTDDDVKPFAGLAGLKAKLEKPDKH
jgi:uncharacterized metal-binding protein YceD (DUF177 family)